VVQKPPAKKKGETSNKKAPNKKTQPRKHHPLPPQLAAFTYEFKDKIIFAMEENPDIKKGKGGDIGPFKMVVKAITGSHTKQTYKEHDLAKLKSEQNRQFALNLGCTKVGSLSKFLVRKEIALRIELGVIYDQVNMPSVRTTADERS
jgi:hypothetical protein